MEWTVAILAGGLSTRFGQSKATADLNGEEFIGHIANAARDSKRRLMVGGEREIANRHQLEYVEDLMPNQGPFSGLLAALQKCETQKLLLLPCDVPWIDRDSCLAIIEVGDSFDVRVARTSSPQWLCSCWRKDTLPILQSDFSRGNRAIHRAVEVLRYEFVDLDENLLRNVNHPSDLM